MVCLGSGDLDVFADGVIVRTNTTHFTVSTTFKIILVGGVVDNSTALKSLHLAIL